ncbi:MAG: phenylacetate--CoA ligase family protein [Methanobrevibacter wolinii]|uniref:phenylacetate--CoA ligase family protein n=1 Tax=Methanobrevibacter wolinii TaxID=190977 RepID=UPI0005B2D11D|nr:phenylacetate--CoA ligase [Methanobrevibacter wolinii]MDD5959611.1 phenylacetate--CoA ligase [Methanobrevibacter wolinii]
MLWDEKAECMERDEINEMQLKKLQKIVKYAFDNVPYYHKKYTECEVFPEDIETLDDIEKLPFTTKDDLRESYPFGMFAVDKKKILEIHSSSGTTGKPVVSGYTKKDLDYWSELMARGLTNWGLTDEDIIQNTHGYGLFTGGFGIHYGAQKIGATVVPISTGQTRRQVELMNDFNTTCLVVTPSYGLYIGEVAKEEGYDPRDLGLKVIGFGSEMWTEEMRQRLQDTFGVPAYNIYGLTEMMGPGVGIECTEQNGLHIAEDFYYPEIIDSNTGKHLPEGTKGELVLTNLQREGMPIIRFRTKDVTALHYEPCKCGKTFCRMERITGRTDDMIKVKGVAVFPSQIEKALLKVSEAEPHYQIIVTRPDTLDQIEVKVETSPDLFSDDVTEMLGIQKKIGSYIQNEIGIKVKVTLVEPKSIPRSEAKAVRVIDKRNFND